MELVKAGLTHIVDLDESRILDLLDAPAPPPADAFPQGLRAARRMIEILNGFCHE